MIHYAHELKYIPFIGAKSAKQRVVSSSSGKVVFLFLTNTQTYSATEAGGFAYIKVIT